MADTVARDHNTHHPDVYVASFYLPELADMVKKLLPEAKVIKIDLPDSDAGSSLSEGDLKMLQDEAEILFCDTMVAQICLQGFKKLRWVQSKGAGINRLVTKIDRQNPPDFVVTRLTANCTIVGEYVMMHVLAIERNLLTMHSHHKQKQWRQVEMADARDITSLTICIIGVGAMGKEVARRCKQLGMRVHGITRSPPTQDKRCPDVDEYSTVADLRPALADSDYICCTLPSTKETKDLLSGDALSVCKERRPVFISIGRGDVINEVTIITAIRESWIRGAVLDVQPVEPVPAESPLWDLPNVFITPHIAGYTKNDWYVTQYAKDFIANYWRFVKGEPMVNLVDFAKGY